MLTSELITDAWYLSGIVARGLGTVSGQQMIDGLNLLNDIIAEQSSDGRFIPYYSRLDFNAVVGQESYFVPNLVQLEELTVTLQEVRYSMMWSDRYQYWGTGRVNNINSLPYYYYNERVIDSITHVPGMQIYVYFRPSQTDYIFNVTGRFNLSILALNDVVSNLLERFYISYLKYKLAHRQCQWYDLDFSEDKMQTLFKLEAKVDDVNPIDAYVKKVSQFPAQSPFTWGDVNLGHFWRP